MIDKQLYQMHETPNAVMHTLAAPSTGASELAVWTVEMTAGQSGPLHRAEHEQVWVVLEGTLAVNEVEHGAGATVVVAAGEERQIVAVEDARALVASRGGGTVTTAQGTRPLPWAA
ncbi:auxin binding protein [Solirubrobacter pauli]|uniref:Auxin binding protein n=1 Tax=Solirubrobacter pauli TaxID=166793 RepID=A0A660LET3_9ACTN|nr:cupin [Solirubrobacter pauli]RKQ93592.1 auxin binding protein [Solirubrobacter pauli]